MSFYGGVSPNLATRWTRASRGRRAFHQATAYIILNKPYRPRPPQPVWQKPPWRTNSRWVKNKLREHMRDIDTSNAPPKEDPYGVHIPLSPGAVRGIGRNEVPNSGPPPIPRLRGQRPGFADDVMPEKDLSEVNHCEYTTSVWIGDPHEGFVYFRPTVGHVLLRDVLDQLGFVPGTAPSTRELGMKFYHYNRYFAHSKLSLPRMYIDRKMPGTALTFDKVSPATLWLGGRWHALTLNCSDDASFEMAYRKPHWGLANELKKLEGP
ncbi:hypothetical protein CDD80_4905 [Ophiocordyceps camponoti-rufipedis]|uniref:Uncharacterized protein n=1 Tax=Ophiocordyceps camponoti-rufipedis TaxID=2004952 RepID=A0A2C5YXZ8_9HYPO|nr:hypothetical protein CDD80_4905 [Ophiocordyceps camponoti-rufipedis]